MDFQLYEDRVVALVEIAVGRSFRGAVPQNPNATTGAISLDDYNSVELIGAAIPVRTGGARLQSIQYAVSCGDRLRNKAQERASMVATTIAEAVQSLPVAPKYLERIVDKRLTDPNPENKVRVDPESRIFPGTGKITGIQLAEEDTLSGVHVFAVVVELRP